MIEGPELAVMPTLLELEWLSVISVAAALVMNELESVTLVTPLKVDE